LLTRTTSLDRTYDFTCDLFHLDEMKSLNNKYYLCALSTYLFLYRIAGVLYHAVDEDVTNKSEKVDSETAALEVLERALLRIEDPN